jgi:phage antirepressor YoqD-like protein
MDKPLFLPYEASIDIMTENELVVWLYQEKITIKKYNVPKYQWDEIEKLYKNSKQK